MKWVKVSLVIFGALVVTALGIDASDTLQGKSGTLLSSVIKTTEGCGPGMVGVEAVPGVTCVDIYEVSTGDACPVASPGNTLESHKNTETRECSPVSEGEREPWVFVTRDQATQLCSRVGKRLPTSAEWYALSSGMADVESSCNVDSNAVAPAGTNDLCTTPGGAYDMVGNVWEWVSDDVIDGMYNARAIPANGYVDQIDNSGVAVSTKDSENELYGNDYFWSIGEGAFGMIRGGFYGSGKDAGLYTVHAGTKTDAGSQGIGFRCVR